MKKLLIFKGFILLSITALSWSDVTTKIKNYVSSDFDIVNDAIESIQKTLIQEHDGKPYFIKRKYNIGENEIAITTKTHFKEYRKKPSYNKEVINVSNTNNAESVVEFIYKSSNKNQITRINKKTKNHGSKVQKIDFHFDPDTEFYSDPITLVKNLVRI